MNTSGEPDELETLMSGSVGGTRKPTVVIQQGGGCLPYDLGVLYLFVFLLVDIKISNISSH